MFRKTRGAILCPYCGRLTNADARECLVCGGRNPGLWGFAGPLRALFRRRRRRFTDVVTIACIILYLGSLVTDPTSILRPRGLLNDFAPTNQALCDLGATGYAITVICHPRALLSSAPWWTRWWTLFTAIYLHGGALHI